MGPQSINDNPDNGYSNTCLALLHNTRGKIKNVHVIRIIYGFFI